MGVCARNPYKNGSDVTKLNLTEVGAASQITTIYLFEKFFLLKNSDVF